MTHSTSRLRRVAAPRGGTRRQLEEGRELHAESAPSQQQKQATAVSKHNMVKRKCLIPQLLGEPLVLWYKAKPVMPAKLNGLAFEV